MNDTTIRDRLDPRFSNGALDRARLLNLAPAYLERCWHRTLAVLGYDDEAVWREMTGRDAQGWTTAERERYTTWRVLDHFGMAAS